MGVSYERFGRASAHKVWAVHTGNTESFSQLSERNMLLEPHAPELATFAPRQITQRRSPQGRSFSHGHLLGLL